ncbi:DUF1583 domain-containing protein [Paludisphaera rhizosphaerae]|uniref:DUF1583 domain-containing protein n=1 Tax=Paludisphaera rhizosphaerae TaxID=2711216 RepID=UPI0013ECDC8F|nr:DUF1583 domain-containing protein [Paludisphaera rhizosphaerae]
MSTSRILRLRLLLPPMIAAAMFAPQALAQQAARSNAAKTDDPADAEEKRQEETQRRFLSLLEKAPRKGTALDRVYGYHVERGTLDSFVKTYADRVAAKPDDGVAWMILGLVEGQRGRDAASVEALRKAEAMRPDDPLPSYYLGQALLMVGQPEAAAAAFEQAIARKPTRNDLLEVFQALGRVYQRTQKTEDALKVWKRLEESFPNDQRVQEQIASALAEEGQNAPALARYEALAAKTTDPFRRVQLGMQAADLKVRLGRSDEALRDFEKLLGQLRPDSWLYRESRQKIEEVFLRGDDRAGLATYYEKWIEKHPEDVDALVRLGRSLAAQGRASASQIWFEKAVKLAPSRKDLRLALIGQLVQDQKIAEAAAQYKAMDEAQPDDPDVLREWGALLLHDTTKPEAQRKADAGEVWRRMLAARPKDPVVTAQVADLFRQAGVVDEALALYRKAIELAPSDVQYHEYLGEYLHSLKRPDEAKAAWAKIAEGPNHNSKGLTRLGEVLSGFGYLSEAVAPLTEAVALDADDYGLRMKFADLLHKSSRYDEAKAQLDAAERFAEKDEEKVAAVEAQVKNDAGAGRLADRSAEIRKDLDAKAAAGAAPAAVSALWARLARYLDAESKTAEAVQAVEKAVEVDPKSIPAWTLAARLRESSGDLGGAAEAYRRLADVDRRNRAEYLTGVAKLEARLGRADAALKAAHDLIAAAPGNPEHYQFLSELCFQLGRNDEGLDALRRAVRIDPNDSKITLALAETLAGQFRTEEAVEVYWKAFERAEDLDAKLGIVPRLTDLYLQRNQFDRLLARLQGDVQENRRQDQQRELAVCLAQAYASSGDLGQARSELERLLAADARDPRLLQQLVKLSEEEGDFESAAKYQKQLVELAPADDASNKLAQLYVRLNEMEEAQAVWSKLAAGKSQPDKVFPAIDSLLANDKPKAALEVVEGLLRKDPRDWEALYREGVALVALKRPEDAVARFRTLMDLRGAVADDEKGAVAKARSRDPKTASSAARPSALQRITVPPLQERINAIYQIRIVTSVESRDAYLRSQSYAWTPQDFGQARLAALAWTLSTAMKTHKEEETLAAFRKAREATPADPTALWDWYWLSQIRFDYPEAYKTAVDLSKATPTDPSALWAVLYGVTNRRSAAGQRVYSRVGQDNVDRTPPLPPAELEHLLACYENLRRRRPELVDSVVLGAVTTELKRAKREADGDRIFRETVASAENAEQLSMALALAGQRADVETIRALSDKYERLGPKTQQPAYMAPPASARARAVSLRLREKNSADAFRLLDDQFAAMRRAAQQRRPGRPRSTANSLSYVMVWNGNTQTSSRFSFPTANEYFDEGAIGVVRTAYDEFKRQDLSSDLAAHLRKLADEAQSDGDAVLPRLALSYVHWWDDDKDAAITEFSKAVEHTKTDSDMRLVLADLLEQRGDPAEALTVVDAVKPLDNATTQRKEEQALRLAILTGDLERARHAAERLFGLRLDTDTQVRLAGQMGQLGLGELSEAVLNRARRRAGNKASSLVGLMLQHQKDRNNEAAVQVAQQILRSTLPTRSNPYGYSVSSTTASPEQARAAAVQVLARSGRLDELIGRVKDQLKTTPNSVQLHQTLADYYKAANRRDDARAELMKVIELRPDDASLRYQTATQLYQEGQAAAAVEQYKAAFQKDPALFGRNYYQVMNAFQTAGKSEELSKMLEEADMRSFGNYGSVMNMIQNMSYDPAQKSRVVPLFRKAWAAFPADRANIMDYVYDEEIWKLPEIYDYACEIAVPDQTVSSNNGEWQAFQTGLSFSSGGQITSLVSRLLDLAAAQNRLDELSRKIEAARAKYPDWTAGKALQALVDCRAGRFDDAVRLVNEVLDKTKDAPPTGYAPQVLGCELEKYGPTRDLAVRFYESALTDRSSNSSIMNEYEYSPIRRLVALYVKDGRKDDARRALLELAKPQDLSNYGDDYAQQMRVGSQMAIGRELLRLGFAVDAAPMLNEAQAGAEAIPPDAPNYYMERSELIRTVRTSLDEALTGMKGEDLAQAVSRFLGSGDGKSTSGVQMGVMVYPRELDKAAIRSLLDESLQAAAGDPKRLGQVSTRLEEIRKSTPDDVATAATAALTALAGGDSQAVRTALDHLDEVLAKKPLEPLPPGGRANARQRAEAMSLIPVWLVARACRKSDEWRSRGDSLATVALEAARRQADPSWNLAMLREQGEQALRRGDRATAEAALGRMLDSILIGDVKKKPAGPQPNQPPAAAPAPAAVPVRRTSFQAQDASLPIPRPPVPAAPGARAPGAPAVRTPAAGTPLLPLDRFEQAMQVAKLAADQGFFELSARAVRESLKGGPPVVVEASPNARRQRVVVRNGAAVEPTDPVPGRVVTRMMELDPIWKRRQAPPELVYETLLGAVAPEARPADLFLYAQPLGSGGTLRARSVGAMLADWAVRAGRSDALVRVVEARGRQPLASAPALVLKTQLALASGRDDDLNTALAALLDRVKSDPLRTTAELAVLAALPALDRPAARKPASQVVEAGLKAYEGSGPGGPAGPLMLALARQSFAAGDVEAGRKLLLSYFDVVERTGGVNYGGDYLLYLRKQHLLTIAGESARAGDWTGALEQFGRFFDSPSYSGGDPPLGEALRLTLQGMASLPVTDRYAALKAWTLPNESRKSVRFLTTAGPDDHPPARFTNRANPAPHASPSDDVWSTASLLVESAAEAGKLDELAKETHAAVEQKVENAETLDRLIGLTAGRVEEVSGRVKSRIDELARENASPLETLNVRMRLQQRRTFPWNDYPVMRAARSSDKPELRALGLELMEALEGQARRYSDSSAVSIVRRELASARAEETGSRGLTASTVVDLPGWSAFSTNNASFRALWVRHQDLTALVASALGERLAFDYPLTGEFELSMDVFRGDWASGGVLYGALTSDPNAAIESPNLDPENPRRPWKFVRTEDFNRVMYKVSPESTRLYVNGHLMREDKPPTPTNPWLVLGSGAGQRTAWRNVVLTGNPTIPREVKLTSEDRLEGWSSRFFNESRMPRRTPTPAAAEDAATASIRRTRPSTNPDDFDWSAEGGVIRGRRLPPSGLSTQNPEYYDESGRAAALPQDAVQSLLFYERPLRDGDVLSYAFYYEPDQVMVHPALGRIAFLLEPKGVRLHWLTSGPNDLSGVSAANAVDVPENRQGDGELPLKPNDWNALTLTIKETSAVLELNGRTIYEHPLEPTAGRRFGLFHDKDRTAVQVRDVVLKGRWPESLSDADRNALALRSPAQVGSEAERRARHAVIGERLFSLGAEDVLASAPADAEARYQALAGWVLPSPDHPVFRLQGYSTPANPPPTAASPAEAGGKLRAPAMAMVEAAAQAGKLAELADRVEAAPAGDDAARRGKLALQAMIATARDDDAAAEAALTALKPLLESLRDASNLDEWLRWPELTAAAFATERKKATPAVLALLDVAADWAQKKAGASRWETLVKGTRSLALLASLDAGVPPATGEGSSWASVDLATAETRGNGSPSSHWLRRDAELAHLPGHFNDYLYLATPLRGDFQLDCELTSFGWREARISYAGVAIAPKYDLNHLYRLLVGRRTETIDVKPPLAGIGDWFAYRLVVKGNRMTIFINDRQVYEANLPAERDPWLAVHASAGSTAGVRKLRITGSPDVPERLKLSALPDLTGWRADYYDDEPAGATADWEKRGDEIVGRVRTEFPGSKQESLLAYHRPMLEDGEISYEFFYDPGRATASPALDRLAFLLDPDGVKVHWMTDAAYDRTGLEPGNTAVETENRRGPASLPLKEKQWNSVVLEIAGDRATLRLNGTEVYSRAIEPANRRTFGFFHFADESEARVRNVSYTGRWPRQLPDPLIGGRAATSKP